MCAVYIFNFCNSINLDHFYHVLHVEGAGEDQVYPPQHGGQGHDHGDGDGQDQHGPAHHHGRGMQEGGKYKWGPALFHENFHKHLFINTFS